MATSHAPLVRTFPRVVGWTLWLICNRFTYERVILDYLQHLQLFTETIGTGVESQRNATAGITQKNTELGLPVLLLDLYAQHAICSSTSSSW